MTKRLECVALELYAGSQDSKVYKSMAARFYVSQEKSKLVVWADGFGGPARVPLGDFICIVAHLCVSHHGSKATWLKDAASCSFLPKGGAT